MTLFYEKLQMLIASQTPFVTVTLVDALGSVPQEVGAKMLVTEQGLYHGTIGGGKVETKAIQEAQQLLEMKKRTHFVQWNLNKDVGMTCGGTVKLYFEVLNRQAWHVVVFGAGHVAGALINLLLGLDCRITCIDPRVDWLGRLPESPRLVKIRAEDMPAQVSQLPAEAFVILMTMGHTTDKPILLEILRTRRFPYLGVIGSRAKAHRLKQDIEEAGLPASCKEAFYCPIGLAVGGNQPQEIAISVAAQLLQERDVYLQADMTAPRPDITAECDTQPAL